MKNSIFLFAVLLMASAFTAVTSGNWQVKDDTYAVKFETKSAAGIIKGLTGIINFDEANLPASNFDVTVDVNTINTGNGMKNKHVKGEDFLDAAKYPTIQFTSSKIEKVNNGFVTTGKLKIKDIIKEVSVPFTFDNTGNEGEFKGNFEINRDEYNLTKKIGETIKIEIIIPVKK